MVINTLPSNTKKEIKPCLEIKDGKDFNILWTTPNNPNLKKYQSKNNIIPYNFKEEVYKVGKHKKMVIEVRDPDDKSKDPTRGFRVCGDLYFRLINANGGGFICRWSINTSFINTKSNMITLTKECVDPDSIKNNPKFEPNFSVTLYFEDECKHCSPHKELSTLCNDCKVAMPQEFVEWSKIKTCLDRHDI